MSGFASHPDHLANALQELLTRHDLAQGMADLSALNRAWYQAAGGRWRACSWILGWRDAELVVGVNTPGAASRLRFEGPAIAQRLQQAGWPNLKGIRARVQPQQAPGGQPRHRRYSEGAARGVAESAAEVADPELRAALQRLAGHLAPSGEGD